MKESSLQLHLADNPQLLIWICSHALWPVREPTSERVVRNAFIHRLDVLPDFCQYSGFGIFGSQLRRKNLQFGIFFSIFSRDRPLPSRSGYIYSAHLGLHVFTNHTPLLI